MSTIVTPKPKNRLLTAFRLNLQNLFPGLITPLLILGALLLSFAMVEVFVRDLPRFGAPMDVAPSFLGVYLFVNSIITLGQRFSVSLSYGLSRRDYYFGTLAYFALLAVVFSTLLTLFLVLIDAINQPLTTWVMLFLLLITVQFSGALATTAFLRFRGWGVVGFIAVFVVLIGSVPMGRSRGRAGRSEQFISDFTEVAGAGIALSIAALLATLGYFLIRFSRPKS